MVNGGLTKGIWVNIYNHIEQTKIFVISVTVLHSHCTLQRFVDSLHTCFVKENVFINVKTHHNSLCTLGQIMGNPPHSQNNMVIRLTLRDIERSAKTKPKRVTCITALILKRMEQPVKKSSLNRTNNLCNNLYFVVFAAQLF